MQELQMKPIQEQKKHSYEGPVGCVFDAAKTGTWRIERPNIDFDSCSKCGTCMRYCPTDVIEIKKEQSECVVIDFEYCKGCGICANECPRKCITMVMEGSDSNGL